MLSVSSRADYLFAMQQPFFDTVTPSAVKEQLYALWQEAFGDSREFIDAFFSHFSCDECAHTLSVDGRVVAALYALPFTLYSGGRSLDAAYIYAVATSADSRGKGYMRLLMERVELLLRERGVGFIFLLPAGEELRKTYSRLGFETCSHMEVEALAPRACDGGEMLFKEVSDALLLQGFCASVQREHGTAALHQQGSIAQNIYNCTSQGGGAFALFCGEEVAAVAFALVVDGTLLLPGLFARSSAAEEYMLHSLCTHFGVEGLRVCRAGRGKSYCMGRSLSAGKLADVSISLLLDK